MSVANVFLMKHCGNISRRFKSLPYGQLWIVIGSTSSFYLDKNIFNHFYFSLHLVIMKCLIKWGKNLKS